MTWDQVGMLVAITLNVGATVYDLSLAERCRRHTAETRRRGEEWIANAERLDALAQTVRRMLEDEAPSVVILAALDAEHRRLS